jgi:hypothetical protein
MGEVASDVGVAQDSHPDRWVRGPMEWDKAMLAERHSAITDLAEAGVPLPLLMASPGTHPCAPCSVTPAPALTLWPR